MRNFLSLKRNVEIREPKKKFIIYTEGKNTEPEYFTALKRSLSGTLIDIEIIQAAGAPNTIADKARERAKNRRTKKGRSSFEEHDEIWAVFDQDEHPNIPNAIQNCQAANVGVAYSNPCFELWLILHYEDFNRPDNRRDVQRHLEKLCPTYNHNNGKRADCTDLVKKVIDAETLAERISRRREEEGKPKAAPYTSVYELTRSMRAADEANKRGEKV